MMFDIDRVAIRQDLSTQPSGTSGEAVVKSPTWLILTLAWIVCLGLVGAGVWGYWQGQGDRGYFVDEGVYTYVGWSWAHGEWPYRDVWDHKGPAVYATAMLRTAWGGTDARMLGVQEIVIGVTIAILIAAIAYSLWGSLGPPVALALGTLVWAQRPLIDFGTGSADPAHIHMSTPGTLIALFSTASILCALLAGRTAHKSRATLLAVLAGVGGGLAACTKLNAVAGFIVALSILVATPQPLGLVRRFSLMGFAILGALVPFAAFAMLFRAGGAFHEFVDAYFFFNSIRGGLGLPPAEWLRLPLQIARNLNYAGVATLTLVVMVASCVAAIQGWLDETSGGLVMKGIDLIVPAWLVLELLVWLSNGGAYAFRVYPVLPAAALGGTWLVLGAFRSRSLGTTWALLIFLLMVVPAALTLDPLQARMTPVSVEWKEVVRNLARSTTASDTVLSLNSWRASSIMSLAQRRSASRYITPVPVFTRRYASDARWGELLESVQSAAAPRVILVGAPGSVLSADRAPTVERVLVSLDKPDLRSALIDHTAFPNLERLKIAIARRYRLDNCVEDICVLRRLD